MANSFIDEAFYSLKKEFGSCVELYIIKAVTPNVETGKTVTDLRKIKISKAPVLQTKDSSFFKYVRSYNAANNNFNFGATFGISSRIVLVDNADLPKDYIYFAEQYFIINNQRYNMKDMVQYEFGYAFMVEEVKGQRLERIYDFRDTLTLKETPSEL
jgi:hypothetical protein